jgi:hypothetical protein
VAEILESNGNLLRQRWVVVNRGTELGAVVAGTVAAGTRIKIDYRYVTAARRSDLIRSEQATNRSSRFAACSDRIPSTVHGGASGNLTPPAGFAGRAVTTIS